MRPHLSASRWRALLPGTVLVAAVLGATPLAGCGGPPRAVVRGSVTLDGRPLTAGRVVFEGEGRSYVGTIGVDGRYELRHRGTPDIVPGGYGVAVLPPEPELVADPKTTALREVNPIDQKLYPERYRSTATSGIVKTVSAGEATVDIALTSR